MGPLLGAMFALYTTGDKQQVQDYWRRFRDLSLLTWKWFLIILLLPLFLKISGVLTASIFSGAFPAQWQDYFVPELKNYLKPGFILFIFVFGPLVEEPAWPGWLQHFFQKRQSNLLSGIIVGVVWGIWHIPMFLIPGTHQYEEGFLTAHFRIWMADILGSSIFYAWIFVHTGGSIPAAILFHFSINYFGVLIDFSTAAEVWAIVLKYLFILVLLLMFGSSLSSSYSKPQIS